MLIDSSHHFYHDLALMTPPIPTLLNTTMISLKWKPEHVTPHTCYLIMTKKLHDLVHYYHSDFICAILDFFILATLIPFWLLCHSSSVSWDPPPALGTYQWLSGMVFPSISTGFDPYPPFYLCSNVTLLGSSSLTNFPNISCFLFIFDCSPLSL